MFHLDFVDFGRGWAQRGIFRNCSPGLLLILPLYMQNRLTKLYSKSHELSYLIGQLQRERTLQELEINKLSSLENLSVFADSVGLDLNGVPTKVRVTGAP